MLAGRLPHSSRNTIDGSTRAARRAGRYAPASASTKSASAAPLRYAVAASAVTVGAVG
jgi:hypothetical protein